MADLTPKQRAFVDAYLANGMSNAAAAYRIAYPASQKWAAQAVAREAEKLKNHPDISLIFDKAQSEVALRTDAAIDRLAVSKERVVEELARMAFYDPADIGNIPMTGPQDIAKLPENVRRAIIGWSWDKSGKFTLRLSPKTPSLDLLARHLGMTTVNRVGFVDEQGQPTGVPAAGPQVVIFLPNNGRDPKDGE